MSVARAVPAFLRNDTLRLLRDRFLLGASAYILGCAVALRWLVPWLHAELLASNAVDITPWVPLGVSYFALVNASVLAGMLGGFLLIETREERTLTALQVTPTPVALQLATLSTAVFLVATGIAVVLGPAVGVGVPPWPGLLASAVVGAPTGVVMTLMLATVASNKVEAFAMMKITSFLGLIPIGAWFLPEPWQLLAGVFPPYWGCRIWWDAAAGHDGWALWIVPGLVVSALWVVLLGRRFDVVTRG